ncbi:SDR family oxidoreductase [Pacificoceanicola onchidii]|uniref:SDR family oxidoreductase n=1 Tax=Pacificoceanicola onchidii TaxID=2562685 RepID=UPI0010A40FF3|nr:SDR family oxidoreductase [Pacificoceanicola onchidii]
MSFGGQRIVVTAGGSGIGACLVRRYLAEGARVAYCDLAPGSAPEGALGVKADVTNEAQMAAFFAEAERFLGGVDVLCANAGTGGPAAPLADMDFEPWKACIAANLDGAFLACRWAAQRMTAQGSGAIVLTSSTSGQWGVPTRAPYVAAKWGILGLMKTLAMELGPSGVRVNAICPGAVEGDRMERVIAMEAAARGVPEESVRALYAQGTSLRTWVTADDLADTILFLTSPKGAKISGQAIAVDGHTERMT